MLQTAENFPGLERTVEQWTVSELAKRTSALVTEPEALEDLMKHMPKNGATQDDWQAYRNFLAFGIPDGFQISVAEGEDLISIAEGNHRIKLLYEEMIIPGIIDDFEVPVYVQRVDSEHLGYLTMERASGKQQALHFRFLLNLNWELKSLLQKLEFDVSSYDKDNFDLLESLITRLRTERLKEQDEGISKVMGPFNNLIWKHYKEIFSEEKGKFSAKADKLISKIISEKNANPETLIPISENLSEFAAEIFLDGIKNYMNMSGYSWVINNEMAPSQKKQNLRNFMEVGIKRALFDRVLKSIAEKIYPWERRGSVTYSSISGYSQILKMMSNSAESSGASLRTLVEILGGRRYGHDTTSYSPIHECYDNLTRKISEPSRTKLIAHILDETGNLHESRNERREVLKVINEGISLICPEGRTFDPSKMDQYVNSLIKQDLKQMYVFSILFRQGLGEEESNAITDHVIELVQRSDYKDNTKALKLLTDILIEKGDLEGLPIKGVNPQERLLSRVKEAPNLKDLLLNFGKNPYQFNEEVQGLVKAKRSKTSNAHKEAEIISGEIPLLGSAEDLEQFLRSKGEEKLWVLVTKETSHVLYSHKDLDQTVYVIVKGKAVNYRINSEGEMLRISHSDPKKNYLIGLESFVGMPNSTFSEAIRGEITYVALKAGDLRRLALQYPEINFTLMNQALVQKDLAIEKCELMTRSERERVAYLLIRITQTEGKEAINKWNRQEMADYVGITTGKLNDTLDTLKKSGYLMIGTSEIMIRDDPGLKRLAGIK